MTLVVTPDVMRPVLAPVAAQLDQSCLEMDILLYVRVISPFLYPENLAIKFTNILQSARAKREKLNSHDKNYNQAVRKVRKPTNHRASNE